jgi:hypothetical protein
MMMVIVSLLLVLLGLENASRARDEIVPLGNARRPRRGGLVMTRGRVATAVSLVKMCAHGVESAIADGWVSAGWQHM